MPTIIPKDREDEARIAAALLRAVDDPHDIRTVTDGPRMAFSVSDEVWAASGLGDDPDHPEEATEPEDAPLVGGEPVVPTGPEDEEAPEEPAELPEPPERNAKTEEWADYMRDTFHIETEGLTRTMLIAEYDGRVGAAE